MKKCGLLGGKLGHSYSPAIHALLADYEYKLYERESDELEEFLTHGGLDGMNVTIPYKKSVIPYCAGLSPTAAKLGSVNTIVRRADGSLYGDNTDAFGFAGMVRCSGIEVKGKRAVVLGSGGASATVCAVLEELGAESVRVLSRHGQGGYGDITPYKDAQIIVNATPVGMYPRNGAAAVDLRDFPQCEGVLDVVYNPARTALLLQAEELGIKNAGGLYMLVAQAKRSAELFTGSSIDDAEIPRIRALMNSRMQNIVLIGMPGSGKSTAAARLGAALGREVNDSDEYIAAATGETPAQIIEGRGEAEFRRCETAALAELGKRSGLIIATGGGCVTREENYPLLHQNSVIFWLERDVDKLPTDGRPLSHAGELRAMYEARRAAYARFADHVIDNNGDMDDTVRQILALL